MTTQTAPLAPLFTAPHPADTGTPRHLPPSAAAAAALALTFHAPAATRHGPGPAPAPAGGRASDATDPGSARRRARKARTDRDRRTLVLVDVENQVAGGRGLEDLVAVCTDRFGPGLVFVAAAAAANRDVFAGPCARAGITLLVAEDSTSAADRQLLTVARTARHLDPTLRLVVISGDHAFAALHPDVVLSRNPDGIAARLAESAGLVLRVDPRTGDVAGTRADRWAPAGPGPCDAPVLTGTTRRPVRDRGGRVLMVQVPEGRYDPAFVAAALSAAGPDPDGSATAVLLVAGCADAPRYTALATCLGAPLLAADGAGAAAQAAGGLAAVLEQLFPGVRLVAVDAAGSLPATLTGAGATVTGVCSVPSAAAVSWLRDQAAHWWDTSGERTVGDRWRRLRNRALARLDAACTTASAAA